MFLALPPSNSLRVMNSLSFSRASLRLTLAVSIILVTCWIKSAIVFWPISISILISRNVCISAARRYFSSPEQDFNGLKLRTNLATIKHGSPKLEALFK